jgi:hypothetical protein
MGEVGLGCRTAREGGYAEIGRRRGAREASAVPRAHGKREGES